MVVARLCALSVLVSMTQAATPSRLRRLRSQADEGLAAALVPQHQPEVPSLLQLQKGVNNERGPNITTFTTLLSACQACIEFFPAKQDGEKFHAPQFHDAVGGGSWSQVCRAGACTTRGDIIEIGTTLEDNEEAFCITQVPVPWFAECQPILHEHIDSVYDVTRYCSYREQIFMPPPPDVLSPFKGVTQAFTRLDDSEEQCLTTIREQGTHLWDPMNFCDTDLKALSGCCESVHDSLKCTLDIGGAEPKYLLQKDPKAFDAIKLATSEATELFERFCVPLCQYSREEFCVEYPQADICVHPAGCAECARAGGEWCRPTEQCNCPVPDDSGPTCQAPVVRSSHECYDEGLSDAKDLPIALPPRSIPTTTSFPDMPSMKCKYLETVDVWSQDIPPRAR